MQCPLCQRILDDKGYTCWCSDDIERPSNRVINFTGTDHWFTLWIDHNKDAHFSTFVLDYMVGSGSGSWELTFDCNGDVQVLQTGTNKITPDEALEIIKRYQKLMVFI